MVFCVDDEIIFFHKFYLVFLSIKLANSFTFFAKLQYTINMSDYNRVIESLHINFIKEKHIEILQALTIENFYDLENILIILNKGQISYTTQEGQQHAVRAGEILFIPMGVHTTITYGSQEPVSLKNDIFTNNQQQYFKVIQEADFKENSENFSYITFDVKVFNAVNLFGSLNTPPFVISEHDKIKAIFKNILLESNAKSIGSKRIIKASTEQLVIEIVRYILAKNLFAGKQATNNNYFKDPRLLDIFNYVKDNLRGDLSNRMLATIAHVSEEYVGQYFKMLTGVNLQDYIECYCMEYAIKLLRTTKKPIHEIGKEIGFKDTAYFCRRFKMMFGLPAGKIRKREALTSF